MVKPHKKTYSNGLRVVTIPMKDNPTVTVLVLVGTGSDYETKSINGISHFLEHMCFKGTAKRPTSQAISHELDALGCQYNAFTDHQMTGYYAKADAKKFSRIFDVVSDIYLHSTFPHSEIEKEKGVIIEEINMYEDMPQRHVQDMFQEVLYGDQPAGWNIAGPKENIVAMSRDDFVKYKTEHYVANNTVIVVAGSVTSKDVHKEVSKYFGDMHKATSPKKKSTKNTQSKPNILVKYKKTDQTHFFLGVRTFDNFDKRNATLSFLSAILGAGMSSRLFIKLREEMGVAYYVRAFNEPSLGYGSFQISSGVANARTEEVIQAILKECKKISSERVDKKELDKIKSFLIGNMKLSLESSDDIANFYGGQEIILNKMKTLEEKIQNIKKVTSEDIQKVAKTIFRDRYLNLAIVGPFEDRGRFEKILSF